MRHLLNNENKLFSLLTKMVDAFYLNLLWILFSLPLITAGASTAALYDTVHKTLREERGYVWSNFFGAFKSNFKKATRFWLLLLAVFMFLYMDFWITFQLWKQGAAAGALCYFFLITMLFAAVWAVYVFVIIIRCETCLKQILKDAAVMGIVHRKQSAIVMILLLAGGVTVFLIPIFSFAVPVSLVYLFDVLIQKIDWV